MPRGQLSKEVRLQIQVTKLTKSVESLGTTNKELHEELKLKNQEIDMLRPNLKKKKPREKKYQVISIKRNGKVKIVNRLERNRERRPFIAPNQKMKTSLMNKSSP